MLADAGLGEKLQQVRKDDVDFNVADIARAGPGRDLAQIIKRQHQWASRGLMRGTSASRSSRRAFT